MKVFVRYRYVLLWHVIVSYRCGVRMHGNPPENRDCGSELMWEQIPEHHKNTKRRPADTPHNVTSCWRTIFLQQQVTHRYLQSVKDAMDSFFSLIYGCSQMTYSIYKKDTHFHLRPTHQLFLYLPQSHLAPLGSD